jgi:hypothetical protein
VRRRVLAVLVWTWRYALAALVLLFSRRRSVSRERELPASTRAETWTAVLLFAASLAGVAFVAIYALDDANTQLLGLSIAVALGLVAAALILAAAQVVPQETLEEHRPSFADPEQGDEPVEDAALSLREGSDGVTRRRLLKAAGGAAGVGMRAVAHRPYSGYGSRTGRPATTY